MTLTGCEVFRGVQKVGVACSSEGAASGEIITNSLEGVLGIIGITVKAGKETRKVGLDLFPPGKTGLVFGPVSPADCGGSTVGASGSVIGTVTVDKMSLAGPLNFTAAKGRQIPEEFEGELKDVLEGSLFASLQFQLGLKLSTTQTNEEAVEINAFV